MAHRLHIPAIAATNARGLFNHRRSVFRFGTEQFLVSRHTPGSKTKMNMP
jgi:hypothetical protein